MNAWKGWLYAEPLGTPELPSLDRSSLTLTRGIALAPAENLLESDRLQWWIGLFLALGVLARVLRYGLCFPLWDDESFLCTNFINRSYAELLRPLDFHQVAPVLFLWVERTVVRLFGYSEFALRLFPFACSIASLYLFCRVASRLVTGTGLLLAVAVFAVSYPGIRYSAEAKPYGSDLFVSLVVMWLVVEWFARREDRWLWALACWMVPAIGLSYPVVFAAGGLSLVVGGILWRHRGAASAWRAWFVWNAALVASFAFWFLLSGRVQAGAEAGFMNHYWQPNFPPIREPWKLPLWLLRTHASDFLAFPVGGPNWGSSATLILVSLGLWRLWRRGNWQLLAIFLAPAGLHLVAAALERYPYGGHVKFSQYIAPSICCLIAFGVMQALDWWSRRGFSPRRALAWDCALLAAIGFGVVVRDMACPYKTRSDFRARAFAQSFWFPAQLGEEVACFESDLGLDFVPEQQKDLSWRAQFLCNRAIEVNRYRLRPPNWSRISEDRPLRCVLYRDSRFPLEADRLERWLSEMRPRFKLVIHETVSLPRFRQDDRTLLARETIDSFKFVPRDPSDSPLAPPMANRPDGDVLR